MGRLGSKTWHSFVVRNWSRLRGRKDRLEASQDWCRGLDRRHFRYQFVFSSVCIPGHRLTPLTPSFSKPFFLFFLPLSNLFLPPFLVSNGVILFFLFLSFSLSFFYYYLFSISLFLLSFLSFSH